MSYKIEEIRAWLNGDKNYHLGISYLRSYGNKPATCDSLMKFSDPKRLNTLLNELLVKLKNEDNDGKVIDKPVAEIISKIGNEKLKSILPHDLILKKLEDEWKEVIKQISVLKANLHLLGEGPINDIIKSTRLAVAIQLKKLDQKSSIQHYNMNYYRTYGFLPEGLGDAKEPAVKSNKSAVEFSPTKDENLRKNIARYNSKLKKAREDLAKKIPGQNDKLLRKINEWEEKLAICIAEKKILRNEPV